MMEEEHVDLSLTTRTEGGRTIVVVGGEIDVYTAPKLREQLIDLLHRLQVTESSPGGVHPGIRVDGA